MDDQSYVLKSIKYLKDVLDLDSQPEYDIVDEYDSADVINQPFPLTFHVDDKKEEIYLIRIAEKYVQSRGANFT